MSEHFVNREDPPPGLSSFTRIRLGWIKAEEVAQINPGATALIFLSPLAKKEDRLAVRISLSDGQYYLMESRQPIGYDRVLPDFGLVVLKVNPEAQEGYGTVQMMKANPQARHFSQATYRLDQETRNCFVDRRNRLAVIPLWKEGDRLGVLVTTPEIAPKALDAAVSIQNLLNRHPEPRGKDEERALQESIAFFKRFDFMSASERAKKF